MDKKTPKKDWPLVTEDDSKKIFTHFYGCRRNPSFRHPSILADSGIERNNLACQINVQFLNLLEHLT